MTFWALMLGRSIPAPHYRCVRSASFHQLAPCCYRTPFSFAPILPRRFRRILCPDGFKKLYCDNLFKIGGAFERTKLQYFDVSHCQSHPYSSGFYRKIEQKPAGQDLSILLRQGLKQTLYPMCWYAAARSWLFFTRAFPASL